MSDLIGFTKALATETKELVTGTLEKALGGIRESLAGLAGRLDALEQRMNAIRNGEKGEQGEPGRDGRDAEPLDAAVIAQRAADLIPRPRDGRDVDPLAIKGAIAVELAGYNVAALVREEVARMFATVPTPKDGRDGKDVDVALVKTIVAAMVADLPMEHKSIAPPVDVAGIVREAVATSLASLPTPRDGRDGKDADPAWIKAEIASQIATMAPPKDGRDGVSVTLEDVAPLIAREVDRAIKSFEPPKDGIGVKGLLINRDGHLVATLTDGSTMDVGTVIGRDGKDADPDLLLKMVTETVAKIPRPKDGADGADGLGIEDADLVFLEKAGFVLRLQHGTRTKDLPLPIPFFADVFRIGEHYKKGAIVIHRGVWIATADTRERPGEGATAWRLMAKNGRDGRDRGGEGNS